MTRTRYSPGLGRRIEVETFDAGAERKVAGGNGKARTVKAHGRQIEVETLDTGAKPSKRRRREPDLWIKVPLRLMMAASSAIRDRTALLVLFLLLHLSFTARSQTFDCPNGFLERFGVSRYAKYRALAKLEAAGFIAVRRRSSGRSPVVTIFDNGKALGGKEMTSNDD